MFWLLVAILVVGYLLFRANEEKARKLQDRHSQKRPDVVHREGTLAADTRKTTSAANRSTSSKRPYIKCYFKELEVIAISEWNNVSVLKDVHHELGFRSRKKAKVLRSRLAERLSELGAD